jgi:hypothetical protein
MVLDSVSLKSGQSNGVSAHPKLLVQQNQLVSSQQPPMQFVFNGIPSAKKDKFEFHTFAIKKSF